MKQLIQEILNETDYKNNPYFLELHAGELSKEDFIETQVQFFNAVIFFSRPMAALAAKIPTPKLRLEVVRNVWEEHGEGNLGEIHGTTFIEFLKRMDGLNLQDIETRTLWPEVRIFNTTLIGASVLDEYLIGTGVFGMIEHMFSDISSIIGQGVLKREWLDSDNMIHYAFHEKIDVKHSQDFFDILEPIWKKNDENRYFIEQGLRLGATLFNDLYLGLYRGRKRRWKRQVTGPHTRASGI